MKRRFLCLIPLAFALAAAPAVHAQDWPTRPIRIVVPLAAGGGTDVLARVIALKLSTKLGQPVTVENRTGAAGNIGAEAVFRAPADGYTLLFTQPAPLAVNKALYGKVPFEPEQFVPIALVSLQDIMLAVNPKVPANNLQELIAYAKAHPGKLNYGSSGAGSAPHLAAELLKSMAGVQGQCRIDERNARRAGRPDFLCLQLGAAQCESGQAARDRRRWPQAQSGAAQCPVDLRSIARLSRDIVDCDGRAARQPARHRAEAAAGHGRSGEAARRAGPHDRCG
jgi:hypothetical protein